MKGATKLMKKKSICRLTALFLLCCLLTPLLSGCMPKEEQMLAPPLLPTPTISYDQVKVQKGTIENNKTGTAYLVSASQQNYFFAYSGGVIEAIHVKAGDTVKKGDVLVSLYTDSLDNTLAMQKLTVAQSQLALDNCNADLSDYAAKHPGDTSSKDYRAVSSAAQNAQFNLEKAQLQLDQYNQQKERSVIVSTINGVVISVAQIGAGATAMAFQSLVTVADPSQLRLQYDGQNVNDFLVGSAVSVTYKDQTLQGTVVSLPASPTSSTSSGSKAVQIKVDNLPKDATIGESAELKLTVEKKENVLYLPTVYVHTANGKSYVNMLDKNGLRIQRDVEVGITGSMNVEIVKGLNEGDSVIA